MKTKRITRLALLTAIALTIFLVEAQIPALVPIPGIKLGLANIVTVFTVYALGSKDGCLVLAARIFLGAVFAGNFSTILYSAAASRGTERKPRLKPVRAESKHSSAADRIHFLLTNCCAFLGISC